VIIVINTEQKMTKEVIEQYNYQHFIRTNKSYSTQNRWINAIKLYLKVNDLSNQGLNQIERPRKQRKLPNVLSTNEVQAIFHNTPNLKHRALLMLVYGAGLRIGEALNLKLQDIRSNESLIYIRGGKGKKDRRVPLSVKLLEILRFYYKSYHPSVYVFEGSDGGCYSNSSASQVLHRSAKCAGISSKVTLHTVRHSYATHLTNKGVNI